MHPAPRRLSTTDLIGPTLLFLGGFLLAVAIALPTLLAGQLREIPLSTDFTTVAVADEATVFDRCSLATPTARTLDARLVRQQRVVAVQPSDADLVTLQAGTSIQAETVSVDGRRTEPDAPRSGSDDAAFDDEPCATATVAALKDRVTLDRTTAQAVGNSEIQYDADTAPMRITDRRGVTYVLPFDAEAADGEFFDPVTRRTVGLRYDGDTQVDGRDVARFVAVIPDTDLSENAASQVDTTITRPAGWFGIGGDPRRELTATLHHRATWQIAVDLRTGVIVDETIAIDETYRLPAGTAEVPDDFSLPSMRAEFRFDDDTRSAMTRRASDLATPLLVWGRLVPIGCAALGLVAMIAGAVALRARPRGATSHPMGTIMSKVGRGH